MKLIEKEIIHGRPCLYYDGIDFEMIRNHPKDGSKGFIVFMIESFINEIKNHNRDRKINSILQKNEFVPFDTDEITHDFVGIYQYDGVGLKTMLSIVKNQIRDHGNDLFKNINEYH